MKVVFRPHCNNCGYEFQELQGVTVASRLNGKELKKSASSRETTLEPSHCPKCHEPIEGLIYFTEYDGGLIFNYSKLFTDHYVKELEKMEGAF